MIRHRTLDEVRRFTWFKVIALIIMILLLLVLSLRGRGAANQTAMTVPATAVPIVTAPTIPPTEAPATAVPPTATPTPEPPTLSLPAGTLRTGPITLSGRGEPGSTVAVAVAGEQVGTAVVGSDGAWTYDTVFADAGDVDISVQALDPSGKVAAEGDRATLTIAPAIVAPAFSTAGGEELVFNQMVTLEGTGTPGTAVEIVADGEVVGTAVVNDNGAWTYDYTPASSGDITLQARALDADGVVAAEGSVENRTVLLPAPSTVLDTMAQMDTFTTLLAAIDAAGLTETLSGEGPFTLFAPTDEAFDRLPAGMVEALLANPEALAQVLSYHVVAGELMAAKMIITDTLTSAAELPIPVTSDEEGRVQVQYSTITAADVEAANGVIHVIDRVMLPPLVEPPVIDESGVPIFAGGLLTVVGSALPESKLLLTRNDISFGETTVAKDGSWLVADNVAAGEHQLFAYTIAGDGTPLAVSKPVLLVSP